MKVVLISPLPPPVGGVATWTQAYLEAAGDAGFQTVCVNTNYEGRTQLVTGRRSIRDELKRAARIWRDVRRKVRSEAPDVVHLCSACSLTGNLRDLITFGVARAACRSARLILHCHCSLQDYVGGSGLNRRVFRWLCRRTDSVLVLNRQSQRYAEELGVRGVRCVPNFAAGPEVEPADAPDQDDCFRVLFLGRTTFDKGFDVLAEVARRMQEANRRVVFDVVGPKDEELSRMGTLPPNMTLHGPLPHEEAMARMRRADAFMLPSRTEGFPYVVLEAMMYGVPVVASDVGSIGEMLEGTGAAVLPSHAPEDFCQALQDCMDGGAAGEISRKEKERYQRLYTPQSVMAQLKRIYSGE